MTKKIILGVVAVVALLLIYAGVQNPNYEIKRSVTINAPAEKIFPLMNSQKLADQWGPWKEEDPKAVMNYSGPGEGVGAVASWDSGGNLGTGSATIVESVPNQKVTIKLEYTKPFQMQQMSDYLLEAGTGGTLVTWKVTGQNNFMGRFMCIFMNMDKLVGGMFEKGLNNLKKMVESQK